MKASGPAGGVARALAAPSRGGVGVEDEEGRHDPESVGPAPAAGAAAPKAPCAPVRRRRAGGSWRRGGECLAGGWRGEAARRRLGPEVAPAWAATGEDVPVPEVVAAGVSAAAMALSAAAVSAAALAVSSAAAVAGAAGGVEAALSAVAAN